MTSVRVYPPGMDSANAAGREGEVRIPWQEEAFRAVRAAAT